jgi:regulator of protease activity HflC (stomatin/prohibitin superfamily)
VLDRLVDFLIQFVSLAKFWEVVNQYEQGVLLRLGKFVRVLNPGLHFVFPLAIDYVHKEVVVMRTQTLGSVSTTTTDGKQVGFEVIVTHKINDIETAVLKVDQVEDAIKDACAGTVGQFLSACSWADMSVPETMDKLTAACRKRGWKYGIEVMSVQLAGVSIVKNIRLMNSGHVTHI